MQVMQKSLLKFGDFSKMGISSRLRREAIVLALSNDQVREILAAGKKGKASKTTEKYLTTEGWVNGKVPRDPMDIGSFEGKVGTMRRSRRGISTRNPNGSRRYTNPQAPFVEGNVKVLAYKL